MSFFILGLPRSRTAWLANFMTHGGYHCHHEGSNGCNTVKEYTDKFDKRTGDANTGIYLTEFQQHFLNVNIVVIDSPITESVDYAKEKYGIDATEDMLNMKDILDNTSGLHISIFNIDKQLKIIWDYLTGCAPYDAERAEMLKGFDIQIKEPYIIDVTAAHNFMEDSDAKITL